MYWIMQCNIPLSHLLLICFDFCIGTVHDVGQSGLERAKWRGGGSHPRGLGEGQHGTLATRG